MARNTPARRPSKLPTRAMVARADAGWENQFSGVGTSIDRRTFNTFGVAPRLVDQEIDELVRGDDMAAKIVNKPANDMLRAGFEVTIEAPKQQKPAEPGAPAGEDDAAPIGVEGDEGADTGDEPAGAAPTPKADALARYRRAIAAMNAKAERGLGPSWAESDEIWAARLDAFGPPGKGPPGGAFGAPPPPPKPPGVVKAPDDGARQQSEDLKSALEDLEVSEKFAEAIRWCRAKGGSAIYVGVDGAGAQATELNPEKIKAVKFLTVFEKSELQPVEWYADPFAPKFGKPSVYLVQPRGVPGTSRKGQPAIVSTFQRVHETRLIIFQGVVTSRNQLMENNGWGDSVLTVVINVLRDYDTVWSSTAALVADYSQPIFKIKALAEALAADRKDILANRIKALMMSRSMLKAAVIDAEEDFKRDTASLTGLAELLDKWSARLAAAAEMPITLLMGQSPGGMNATGESDIRGYYDNLASKQNTELRKPLERLIRLVLLSTEGPTKGKEPDDWRLKFNPLWQMSEKEKAEIYGLRTTADVANVGAQIATPEEIAASRFSAPDSEIVIDFEGREQMAVDHEQAMAKHAVEKEATAKEAAKAGAPGAPPPVGGKPPADDESKKPPAFVGK